MKKNIVIAILIIALVGAVGYIGYDKVWSEKNPKQTNEKQKEIETEPKEEVLETTDQVVLNAMNKINSAWGYYCGTDSVYMTTKKVTAADISNDFAYVTVMNKLATDTNSPVPASRLDQAIDETFGKDYQFEHKNYSSCPMYSYDAATGNYNFVGSACGGTCGPTNIKEIVKAIKKDQTLEIYIRVIFSNPEIAEGERYSYCKDSNLEQIVGYLSYEDRIYNEEQVTDLVSKGSLYKFTFKLEDGNYVFYSSELQ